MDLNLVALTPAEIAPAQDALVAWCGRKLQALADEADELALHQQLAVTNGWNTSVVTAALNRTARRVTYYTKMREALQAGYLLVPNMPVEVLAVRVQRAAPRPQTSTSPWHTFQSRPELLPAGVGRYVDDQPLEASHSVEEVRDGKPVTKTEFYTTAHDDDVDFPIALTKPQVLDAVARAMALKVFDQIGRVQNRTSGDPIYVGQLLDPRGNGRCATFFLAWWLDTTTL